jgi:hypothetical protein
MLAEFQNVRQIPKEGHRRWFTDDNFDLIVWYDDHSRLTGFQLCYDKTGRERALTWTVDHGFQHNRIDAGETPGHMKMTPVIVADGEFDARPIADLFLRESSAIDPLVSRFVYSAVAGYPRRPDAGAYGS